VAVAAAATYTVNLWVRTAAITNGVSLAVNWYNASGLWLAWDTGIGGRVTGTTAWHAIRGVVTAPAQATAAVVQIRIESTGGTAWLDDVSLQASNGAPELPEPPEPSPSAELNLLPNADMEAGPWDAGAYAGTSPVHVWATDSSRSATHALRTSGNGYYFGYWHAPPVAVTPAAEYEMGMWVRTVAITQGITLAVHWHDATGSWLGWETMVGGNVTGTTPWHAITDVVTAPAGATSAMVQIRIESMGGTAWIDDVSLQASNGAPEPEPKPDPEPKPRPEPAPTPTQAVQHTRWEGTFTSTRTYANPFLDVTLRVEYTSPTGQTVQGYGFWDGDDTFKIRMAFPTTGRWSYRTTASNRADTGLHGREGWIDVRPYTGNNPLYRHGPLRISADRRYLTHADGTPFLWVGDTLWGATVWLTDAGFREAINHLRAKRFTVLQTNVARKAERDMNGDTPWDGDRWNVRFMQKLDRMLNYANDQGLYLFINGLIDLLWDRQITKYQRLVEMIAIRYAAHHLSFASSMDDGYAPEHEAINAAIARVAPQHLLTQHPNGDIATVERYYAGSSLDYGMLQTGGAGTLETACFNAITQPLHLYRHPTPRPIVNGETWYEAYSGGTGEIAVHLAYLSLLSGAGGYTHGTRFWNARDADLTAWKALSGATYMHYLFNFFHMVDEGRPLVPRHDLVVGQASQYQDWQVIAMSADKRTYVAFLPKGGAITLNLRAIQHPLAVTWYHPLTGEYRRQAAVPGRVERTFTAPFGSAMAVLRLDVID
jgi:hypothetical protein